MRGTLRAYLGDTKAAFRDLEAADRLAPLDVHVSFKTFGRYLACFVDGNYEGAIEGTAKQLRESPGNVTALRYRTAALALSNRLEEARRTVNQLLAANPEVTISRCLKRHGLVEAYYQGLRLAGLPE